MSTHLLAMTTWGPIANPGERQNHYYRIPFAGAPTILASSYLAEVSVGLKDGVMGIAVATFKRFEYLDDGGLVQEKDLDTVLSCIKVERCISITIALDLIDATALGGWTFMSVD